MKKIASLLILAFMSVALQAALTPRGEIVFVTDDGGSGNPVFDVNGTTRLGSGFYGQLYVGLAANSLQAVGSAIEFGTGGAGLGFLAAPATVFWNSPLNATTMPVGDQAGVYVLRAWSGSAGSTFESASSTVGAKVGSSTVQNVTGFGGVNASGNPSGNFAFANTHASFSLSTVAVPEPTTLALGLFGAAGLLIRRRK